MAGPLPKSLLRDVPLSPLTTIGLGGAAQFFASCMSVEEISTLVRFAKAERMRLQLLGGGSNIIFADAGFKGLVLQINLKGRRISDDGEHVILEVAAGEEWDSVVQFCVEQGFSGIECLSGIPGFVGATPIQNVGAYGQEVAETIVELRAVDLETMREVEMPNAECRFGYRQSRFKKEDRNRFVVTHVTFRLKKNGRPAIRYPELKTHLESACNLDALADGAESLRATREAVLALRRRKSMVIDPHDPNTRSVGSFFMNPVLTIPEFQTVQGHCHRSGTKETIPTFPAGERIKIPAAWLVEQTGYKRGFRRGGVGVSSNHALALINTGGTSQEVLDLARDIQRAVQKKFAILLEEEPVVVP